MKQVWEFAPVIGIVPEVQIEPPGKQFGLNVQYLMVIIVAALGLFVVFILWALLIRNRKPRKNRRDGQKVFRAKSALPTGEESDPEAGPDRKRYKYRWKRRRHRARNPSLAETGGLPNPKSTGGSSSASS